MTPPPAVAVTADLAIPIAELEYRASRSGGPGGQHVNTSSTRIEVWWDIARSAVLSDEQRERLLRRLATRLDSKGRLRLVSGATRSQLSNKEEVTARLGRVVADALRVPRPRKKTRPSRAARERRLEAKRRQAAKKQNRRRRPDED
ncbi:MAG: alternative ribosome rescue aminoacyl-tRNA hydrolase ArfB [Gemmatimonadales bacterium]